MLSSVIGIWKVAVANNYRRHRDRNSSINQGFTLIELLVVILIISIVAAFAVVATGDFGRSRRVEVAANGFTQNIRLASEQAILEANVLGVSVTAQGYEFYRYQVSVKTSQSKWQVITNDTILHYHKWPQGIHANLLADNNIIVLEPTGDISPFSVLLIRDHSALFRICANTNGLITTSRLKQ